jgi:RNA polymerase sigma-70 factor (ECF subfamily)
MTVAVASSRCAMTLRQTGSQEAEGHGRGTRDTELVERVRAGNTAAFGELVERHRGAVYRAALTALGNAADAEDVAQEALVLAFRRIGQFRGEASVRTWMVSIAWRLCLSRRRRGIWRLRKKMANDSELTDVSAATLSPEALIVSAEFIAAVRRQIQCLPPKLRDALLLTAAGDMTQEEIAAALRIPAATFRGRVLDARRRLKQKLGL